MMKNLTKSLWGHMANEMLPRMLPKLVPKGILLSRKSGTEFPQVLFLVYFACNAEVKCSFNVLVLI